MEKKQNVLIVHNYYQIPGGEDTVVKNEMNLLQSHGHKVILYSRNNTELKQLTLWKKIILPITMIFSLKTYREIKQIVRDEQIDIVHVHNTLTLVSPSVYYAALHSKVPVCQTIHNFRLLCPGATFYRDGAVCEECVNKGLICAVRHNCYRNSKIQTVACVLSMWIHRMTGVYGKLNYICLTEFNKEKLLMLKQIRQDKVYVKPNFVETIGDAIPYGQRKKQFVFAGRLDKLKGIDILLQAWKEIGKDAPKLIVCGTGPMQEWCQKFVKENKLDTVELKGFVPNEETKRIIAESQALILPTQWYEGFPMTIVEACAQGTPVIGSNTGNVGALIRDGMNGISFQKDSVEGIIGAVKEILNKDLIDSTSQYYFQAYTEELNYKILNEIYEIIGCHDKKQEIVNERKENSK